MTNTFVELRDITKAYTNKTVLRNLSLGLADSEMVALLGPSGCGKSTTLKILAGLEYADAGRVLIDGEDVTYAPTRKRNIGIVFQAYSLFPHMSAVDNVAYGLKIRGVDKAKRREQARALVELVGLNEHGDKYPAQLSGGQQQRVALARALAIAPKVLLLDEPLSALDAKVRSQLRDEIRRIQLAEGISTLLVTHDQEEALIMADRVGVMNQGVIEQIGTPEELYHHPCTPFISSFVGVTNRMPAVYRRGTVELCGKRLTVANKGAEFVDGNQVVALIRPEEIRPVLDPAGPYVILDKQLRGIYTSVTVVNDNDHVVRIDMSTGQAADLQQTSRVRLDIAREETVIDQMTAEELRQQENPQVQWGAPSNA